MARRRSSLATEAATAVFQLASLGGLGAGMLWALNHPTTPKPCADTSDGALGKCMGDTLWSTAQPYIVGAGGGLIAGALLAVLLVTTARLLAAAFRSTPRRNVGTSPSPAARPVINASFAGHASVNVPTGQSMVARYPGRCSSCRSAIRPGDRITHVGRQNNRCSGCS